MSERAAAGMLIAFPGAGGGTWMFAGLRRALSAGLELLVPDLPGRGKRARDDGTRGLHTLVGELCDEITEQITHRPYAVFGSSFGSLVGFELLREIRCRGLPAPEVFQVSGREPPDVAPSFAQYASRTDRQLREYLQRDSPVDTGNPAAVQLQDLILRQLRIDITLGALYEYVAEEPLDVPIYAYHSADDHGMSPGQLAHWRAHTKADFRLQVVPGGHNFYLSDCSKLVADLSEVLS